MKYLYNLIIEQIHRLRHLHYTNFDPEYSKVDGLTGCQDVTGKHHLQYLEDVFSSARRHQGHRVHALVM